MRWATLTLAERFWAKVARGGDEACWPWLGCKHVKKGHGQIRLSRPRQTVYSHRLAWELTNGTIPDGLHVLHKCDNPPCCNPAHLFVGTNADNVADMIAKARQAKGRALPQTKVTETDVREIRFLHTSGATKRELAQRYGLSRSSVHLIVIRKNWRHVA